MEKKTRLERFADWFSTPFFALSYVFFTCMQAIKGGYVKAEAENLPPQPTETK